jgi:hypothetical protein
MKSKRTFYNSYCILVRKDAISRDYIGNNIGEMWEWCIVNCLREFTAIPGPGYDEVIYLFEAHEDAMLFTLRWNDCETLVQKQKI